MRELIGRLMLSNGTSATHGPQTGARKVPFQNLCQTVEDGRLGPAGRLAFPETPQNGSPEMKKV